MVPQEINFEVYQDRLTFCLYEYHSWPEWTFHWLPVSFIDRLEGPLKRIAITFIHEFARSNGMSYLDEWGDLEWVLEWMDGYASGPDPDKEERKEYRRTIRSYCKGHADHAWSAYKNAVTTNVCGRRSNGIVPRMNTKKD